MKFSDLSIEEIRAQFLYGNQPVTAQFLTKLSRDPRQGVRKMRDLLRKRFEKERAERVRMQNMLNFERLLWKSGVHGIAGVDEVGVGPLAGPVVAAAVVFPPGTELLGIDDSKKLDSEQRARLAPLIRKRATAVPRCVRVAMEIDDDRVRVRDLERRHRSIYERQEQVGTNDGKNDRCRAHKLGE